MTYSPLGQSTLPELERELLATWEREGLFHQTLRATRDGEPFVFFEGPPTANGRPGIHHVFARTIKDLVCRYHTMRGRQVTRIAGWVTMMRRTSAAPTTPDSRPTMIAPDAQIHGSIMVGLQGSLRPRPGPAELRGRRLLASPPSRW